jgi:hypothetical protein
MKNELKNQLRQQDASALAQGYSPAIRAMEPSSGGCGAAPIPAPGCC